MPRKSTGEDLQVEEVSVRRSTRISINSGNGTPSGITTRRRSQTADSDTPARTIRTRRASAQDVEDNSDNSTATSKRASILKEEESQQKTTPAKRGRRTSVTTDEPTEELEKPKTLRARRNSRAHSEDIEEEKVQKTLPVKTRRSSASAELEVDVKVAPKTPARATTRRRSSAAENIAPEEVSTPAKRATRSRRASVDTDEIEETKKPAVRGRRKSLNQEEETKVEEVTTVAPRRGRRASTDNSTEPKTPARTTRRSVSLEPENLDSNGANLEEKETFSPFSLKDVTVRVTPIKKRKILDKIEAELDLSIINESVDDINSSKDEQESLHPTEEQLDEIKLDNGKAAQNANETSHITEKDFSPTLDNTTEILKDSKFSSTNKERLSTDIQNEQPPVKSPRVSRSNTPHKELTELPTEVRKSPRLSEKLSRSNINTPQNTQSPKPTQQTPTKSVNVPKEDDQKIKSFVSSGSDSSFRFHLSTVSMPDTTQNIQDDVLNISKESTGSNKENIELTREASNTEDPLVKSVVIPVQEPIVLASRISNVFKPNQKESSFMVEPMEVDEYSFINKSLALDESSVIFNKKAPQSPPDSSSNSKNSTLHIDEKLQEELRESSSVTENVALVMNQLKTAEDALKASYTETEGSDHLVIEETEEAVDISVKPHLKQSAIENVKIMTSRKSSSPITAKRRLAQKSKSPIPNNDSTDSESELKNTLRVSTRNRRSKSKSKTPSPIKYEEANFLGVSKNYISKTPDACNDTPNNPKKRLSRSPSFLTGDSVSQNNSLLSGNRASRSKSKSPLPHTDGTPLSGRAKRSNDEAKLRDLEQSFEKPRGSEEVLIANENIPMEVSDNVEEKLTESERDSNVEEITIVHEQTEYHTAVATTITNNDSEFKSLDNNEVTASELKHSESTHYDFDLPSDDDDDCLNDPGNVCDGPINSTNISVDKRASILKDEETERVLDATDDNSSTRKNCEVSGVEDSSKDTPKQVEPLEGRVENHSDSEDDVFEENEDSNVPKIKQEQDTSQKKIELNERSHVNTENIEKNKTKDIRDTVQSPSKEIAEDNTNPTKETKSFDSVEEESKNVSEEPEEALTEVLEINSSLKSFDKVDEKSEIVPKEPAEASTKIPEEDSSLDIVKEGDVSEVNHQKVSENEEGKLEEFAEVKEKIDPKTEEDSAQGDKEDFNETVEDITTIKMAAKAGKADIKPISPSSNETRKSIKSRPSLDEFAMSKLSAYIKSKAQEVDESSDDAEEEEDEYNGFIDGMAEEGEEDTPSEDSNEIIDEGESIGSSDSEDFNSQDDYDQNDSFICDDEHHELLSGDEYDLGHEKKTKKPKKSKIIDPESLGDEDIIKIPKKKSTVKDLPKKRSRIIELSSDSSDEDETNLDDGCSSVIVINDSENVAVADGCGVNELVTSVAKVEDNTTDSAIPIEDSIEIEDSTRPEQITETGEEARDDIESSITQNESVSALNSSLQKRRRKSSLSIQESILVDGVKDPLIYKRINNLVESFCSTVKKGEISLNLSLEYEDSPEDSAKDSERTESIHILSDIKICPSNVVSSSDHNQSLVDDHTESLVEEHAETAEKLPSADEIEDPGPVMKQKQLKRRLSKSLSEIYEEEKKAKRRKKNKKKKKKSSSEENLNQKSKKAMLKPDLTELPKMGTFNLMNQLITDVKNRPKRVIKPTTTAFSSDSSWIISEVANIKPSKTPVSREELLKAVSKLHPKDFKNQLLSDPKRVKRLETKRLLKKKGAFL